MPLQCTSLVGLDQVRCHEGSSSTGLVQYAMVGRESEKVPEEGSMTKEEDYNDSPGHLSHHCLPPSFEGNRSPSDGVRW